MALFKGGIPTSLDVENLLKRIDVGAGTAVPYAEVEKVLGIDASSSRFRTVTQAWRKNILRNKRLISTAEGGTFTFLTADQAHDHGKAGLRRIGRAAGRLALRVEMVDVGALSGEKRESHRLLQRETTAVLEQVRKSAKVISPPSAVRSHLRIAKGDTRS